MVFLMVNVSESHDTFTRGPRLLALAFLVVSLGFAVPASAQSDTESPDDKAQRSDEDGWQRGEPVRLSDRINLRDNMTLFQLGVGPGVLTGAQQNERRTGVTAQAEYRTAISDTVDYLFPLIFSVRYFERQPITMAVDAGLNGIGYASSLGLILSGYVALPTQIRFSDSTGLTLKLQGQAFIGSEPFNVSYTAAAASIFEWTTGGRLQGGVGTEFAWNQNRFTQTGDRYELNPGAAHRLLVRVGGVDQRPLIQVRIHKGFHLYESSRATVDARSFELLAHQHILGFRWYY